MSDHAHVHTAGSSGRLARFREATAAHVQKFIAQKYTDQQGSASTSLHSRFAVRATSPRERRACLAVARSAKADQRMIFSPVGAVRSVNSRSTTPRLWL